VKKIKIEKPLCKLKKDQLATVLPILAAEITESRFICRRCGRAAKSKKWLCKPGSIEKVAGDHPVEQEPLGFQFGGDSARPPSV
jgi:hypothetical protein